NDQLGRDHARQVARSLHGAARSIKVVEMPGLKEKGDVSDWLADGHTPADLIELVKTAAEWTPPHEKNGSTVPECPADPGEEEPDPREPRKSTKPVLSYPRMTGRDLWDAEISQEWLIDDVLAAGQPSVVGALKKSLKTTIAIEQAVSVSAGIPFLGKFNVPK